MKKIHTVVVKNSSVDLNNKSVRKISIFRLLSRIFAGSILLLGAVFISIKSDIVSGQTQQTFKDPTELKSEPNAKRGGDLNFNLEIKYALNKIFNPSSGKYDTVNLRNYNGELVGPTMRVRPGYLMRINLQNRLPMLDPTCQSNESSEIPHCFNSTNLHTHGWHVSPTGNGDNVLLDIKPGTGLDFEYYLPKDHPAGTFWYHSHRHGSTALQVSSGMAGTLIVEGFRALKDKAVNGIADIDTILKDAGGKRLADRIFMFEQIQYACLDDKGVIITDAKGAWVCPDGKIGGIEQYGAQFGPPTWQASGRFTMINGMLQPLIETQTGKIERWRLIHGGVRDTINFRVTRSTFPDTTRQGMNKTLADLQSKAPDEQNRLLLNYCGIGNEKDINQTEFAVDGLTRKQMSNKTMNILQPGYRSDILVAFDKPGIYCVLDEATPPSASINDITTTSLLKSQASLKLNDTRLLSMVFVSGGTPFQEEPQDYIVKKLIAANQDLPELVKNDLKQFRAHEFAPHPDISPTEVTGTQELSFAIRAGSDTINTTKSSTLFQIANKAKPEQSDYFSYDPDRIDRLLRLGGVDEWTLTSGSISHPFHIHINPFQIIQILDELGNPVVDKNGNCVDTVKDINGNVVKDQNGKPLIDPQYCDQIGIFRDTLLIKNPKLDFTGLSKGYTITMRTRYQRYIGDFVLHCHILDHEDGGMMQNVRIAPIGGYIEGNPVPTEGVKKHGH